eukprot:gene19375-26023_t
MGFLQYDSWGGPAFIHRTIDKYSSHKEPKSLELISAPMPHRWSKYFLDHDNVGPTRGVPWDYVVPDSSLSKLTPDALSSLPVWVHKMADQDDPGIWYELFLRGSCGRQLDPCSPAPSLLSTVRTSANPDDPDVPDELFLMWKDTRVRENANRNEPDNRVCKNANRNEPDIREEFFLTGSCGKSGETCNMTNATATIISKLGDSSCPVEHFLAVWSMKESSLPIDLAPEMQKACMPVLREALGEEQYTEYGKKGWLQLPTLRHLHADYMFYDMPPFSASQALPAWTPHFEDPTFDGPFAQVVRAAYAAAAWMRSSNATFPILNGPTK